MKKKVFAVVLAVCLAFVGVVMLVLATPCTSFGESPLPTEPQPIAQVVWDLGSPGVTYVWDEEKECGYEEWIWGVMTVSEYIFTPISLTTQADTFKYQCGTYPSSGGFYKVEDEIFFDTTTIYLFGPYEISGTREALIMRLQPYAYPNQIHIWSIGTLHYTLGCKWRWSVMCPVDYLPYVGQDAQ